MAGRLGDRIGYAVPVGGGLALLAIGATLFATVDDVTSLGDLWIPLVLCGIGLGASFATASAAAMAVVPPDESGEAAGTLNVSRYVGGAVGVAVGGALFIGQGTSAMNDGLTAAGVSSVEEGKLDAALTGSPRGCRRPSTRPVARPSGRSSTTPPARGWRPASPPPRG